MIRVSLFLIFLITFFSCNITPISDINSETNDTLHCYFSGEVSVDHYGASFIDCATNKRFYLDDKSARFAKQNKEAEKYNQSLIYAAFRGYVANDDTITIMALKRFNPLNRCRGVSMCQRYVASKDTIELFDNYRCEVSFDGYKKIRGRWFREYGSVGVLLIDGKRYPFTINFGTRYTTDDIILSFDQIKGRAINFIPLITIF